MKKKSRDYNSSFINILCNGPGTEISSVVKKINISLLHSQISLFGLINEKNRIEWMTLLFLYHNLLNLLPLSDVLAASNLPTLSLT